MGVGLTPKGGRFLVGVTLVQHRDNKRTLKFLRWKDCGCINNCDEGVIRTVQLDGDAAGSAPEEVQKYGVVRPISS